MFSVNRAVQMIMGGVADPTFCRLCNSEERYHPKVTLAAHASASWILIPTTATCHNVASPPF